MYSMTISPSVSEWRGNAALARPAFHRRQRHRQHRGSMPSSVSNGPAPQPTPFYSFGLSPSDAVLTYSQ